MTRAGLYVREFKEDEEEAINQFVINILERAEEVDYWIEKKGNKTLIRNSVLDVEYGPEGIKGNNKERVAGEPFMSICKYNKKLKIGIPSDPRPAHPRYGAIWCLFDNARFVAPGREKLILEENYGSKIELKRVKEKFEIKISK